MSLGGSVSLPIGRTALCIRSKAIGASTGLSRMLLNTVMTVCEIVEGLIDSGIPRIRRLRRLPLLSRSFSCQLISLRWAAWDSVICCTWHIDDSWHAWAVSTSSTLIVIVWMSDLMSVMADISVLLMSAATLRRSSWFTAGDCLCSVCASAELMAPERWGLTLGERDSREEAVCDGCVLPEGRKRKISGICQLSCISCPCGDRDLVAEVLREVLTIIGLVVVL